MKIDLFWIFIICVFFSHEYHAEISNAIQNFNKPCVSNASSDDVLNSQKITMTTKTIK